MGHRAGTIGAAVTVLVALTAAGCGSQAQAPAHREAAYISQVNRIERQLATPLQTVTRTSAQAAGNRAPAGTARARRAVHAEETSLDTSLSQIGALRGQLAAVPVPAPERHLRALLLAVADQQASLTRQTAQLISFLPAFSTTLSPLGPATTRLKRVLAISQAYGAAAVQAVDAEKAAALRAFRATVDGIVSRLRRLRPPVVSRPEYRAQVDSLEGMSRAAGRLAATVTTGDAAGIAPQLVAFDRAAGAARSVAEQKAQAAADRAYNAQVARVQSLSSAAAAERLRLAQTLQ